MKWKLVKIGEYYALRKWSWFYLSFQYLDLRSPEFYWGKNSGLFRDCLTSDKNHIQFHRAMKDEKV